MFVERGAVEMRQAVLVGRKMRRNPVEDDAETDLVRAVDEPGKPSGSPNRAEGAYSPVV
jgi:hypothetical protein